MVHRAIRVFALGLGLASGLGATRLRAQAGVESFQVDHPDPVTIRVLAGKSGKPRAFQRLILIGGYDGRDIENGWGREEAVTDEEGMARIPRGMAELPFLQVRAKKTRLCQAMSHGETYTVERIRSAGLSAPNRCGMARVADTPGVLVVFVEGDGSSAGLKSTELVIRAVQPEIQPEPTVDFVTGRGLADRMELAKPELGGREHAAPAPSSANEIETLVGRGVSVGRGSTAADPSPVSDVDPPGTGARDDTYDVIDVMCQPGN